MSAKSGQSVPTNTGQVYSFTTIREDLEDFIYKISPTETPIMQSIGRKEEFENTYHEWSVVELAAPNSGNAIVEGADAINDAAYVATRLGNYSQIMDKVAQVSDTTEKVRGAGQVQRMAKQILWHTQALKRDMEARIGGDGTLVAAAGSSSTARTTASFAAFLSTNTVNMYGAGSYAAATLSGGTSGYPSGAEVAGTSPAALDEAHLKTCIEKCWVQGGDPTYVFVGGTNKQLISGFSGNATRFKKAEDKKLVASIDVYVSDFGELQVVPDRFQDASRVFVVDPQRVGLGWLQPMRNAQLAKTGHSDRRMVWAEWGLVVGNQKAHGMIVGTTGS